MEGFNQWLIALGPWGMFISAILAGTVLPFSSEIVMVTLALMGVPPLTLLVTASTGNIIGGMINFFIGRGGNERWMVRYLHVKPEKLASWQKPIDRYGPVAGLLAWVPVIGSVVTVALGYMRAPLLRSLLYIAIGKIARYAIILGVL